ncbi:MAG: hypothetical protein Q8R96_08595 [Bacteroidota bacterium]|nr:hypothetical protein [Bacteroidota bacterium]
MYYILGIIIIAVVTLVVVWFRKKEQTNITGGEPEEAPRQIASDCCGAHEICEFDESEFNEEIITYFDDEELDELRNVRESDLTTENIDDLREVLYTLRTEEIGKWLISIGRRHIHLPAILQQEARQLMTER